ncbi:MAG: ISKra4 family transposase [Geminicoccaceae bacterium]
MSDEAIFSLDKGIDQLAEIGLSLEDGKTVLAGLQRPIIEAQIAGYMRQHGDCPHCRRRLWRKGSYSVAFRTLFGTVTLASPRLYRCPCRPGKKKTFSPLSALLTKNTSPELLYLESKWASLMSFGVTVDLLKDVLPIDRANISTVRRHLNKIAARAEAELGREPACLSQEISDLRVDGADLAVIGIDGGYVRNWHAKKRRFEVVVGKSMVKDQDDRYFGLVQTHDDQPKRRVTRVLQEQGLSMTQEMTFLTDGADNVRNLAVDMSPCAKHLLDWFHLSMRLHILSRYTKGLKHHDPKEAAELADRLERIKWCLWNGKTDKALRRIRILVDDLEKIETAYPYMKRFRRKTGELHTYITNNQSSIPDYGQRRRQGKRIATSFVESTVNTLVGKRFAKSQQMQWSKKSAHHMLQIRARTLDGSLHAMFIKWFPGMATNDQKPAELPAVA